MTDPVSIYILILFIVFCSSSAIQLFYYLFFYTGVLSVRPAGTTANSQAVSVIICARNEGENLSKFLPPVLEQDYPDFEVIVVNDCSEDNSYLVLGNFLLQYPHLKISTVNKDPKFTHNKKFAQFIGIKAAKNELLLFTDADCRPESDQWLRMMTSHFTEKTDFVLGYGGYMTMNGLLNRYIRYDCLTIAIQYLGMALKGLPYMGVGRNLAYRRDVFFKNNGYGAHNHLISGDDDLFVNSNARGKNTTVEFRPETHTRSVPASSLAKWIIQKKRHLTTAPYYRFRDKFLLSMEVITRVIFYGSFIALACLKFNWLWIGPVFAARLITQHIVVLMAAGKLKEPGLWPFVFLFDLFSPLINGILFLSNTGSKSGKNRWR
jgi:poly-beta-1,6-N-acetyl-D-glucosamine synthase